MNYKILPAVCLFVFISNLNAQTSPDTTAYQYILDYQVPTSPAFGILGISPQQVVRAGAAKPFVAGVFTDYLKTQKLNPGIAIDFSPYILLGGGLKNIKEYQERPEKRILANTMLSFATIKNSIDSANMDIGLGVRITLFDSHDLFSNNNSAITNSIGTSLANASNAVARRNVIPEDGIGEVTVVPGLKEIYEEAYKKVRDTKGSAASVGFAYKTTAHNSILTKDSLTNNLYKVWLSFSRYNIFPGADLMTIVQGKFGDGLQAEWNMGAALASVNKASNMGAEMVYNFRTKAWDYGANFEIKIARKFSYIVTLGKKSTINGIPVKDFFSINSNFRINFFSN
ncbi:MAG: hypothetical protein V4450_00020 [Bacteroidota bacterium]